MRLFVVIGGLIVLTLLAALIGPYFVDWGEYRDRFEAEASRILGQDVHVAGSASARLLPFPSVTFSDVRIGPEGEPNITVEKFSMDAELAPFLRGEILIFDMSFVSPVVRLELDDQGRPIWDWPSQAPVDPAQISLENASFTDGTLVLRDAKNKRQWDFVSLNGFAAADSLFGPWHVEGKGLVRGLPFNARIATGSLNRAGFATRMTATLPTQKVEITADGRIAPPAGDVTNWYSGTFMMKPNDVSEQTYRVEGVFEADARSIDVEQFRADFGDFDDPYTVNGSASISGGVTPRFDFEASGNQVSLSAATQDETPVTLGARIDEIQSVLATLPFPPIPGSINLDLPTIVVGKTTIRDVQLVAEPASNQATGQWVVKSLNAKLPGRTVLESNGDLQLGENQRFTGDVVLASRQPSGLAAWLTDDVDDAVRLLPNAGFAASVDLSADKQIFEEIELILGDATLQGSLARQSPGDALPSVDLALAGDNVNFNTLDALSATLFGGDGSFRLSDHDVDIALDLSDALIKDVRIGTIDAAMRVRGDRTEIDRLALTDFLGASVSATGTVLRAVKDGEVTQTLNMDMGVIASDGSQFIARAAEEFGNGSNLAIFAKKASRDPANFRDMALNIVGSVVAPATGTLEASASISGEAGESLISLTSTLQGNQSDTGAVIGSLSGTIDNAETTKLLSQTGFDVFPLRLLGEGQLRVNMSGSLNDGLSARVVLETADSLMSTDGVLKREVGNTRFAGTGSVVTADAEPWMDLFGYIFPSTGLGTSLNGEARVAYQNGAYTLSDLNGDVAGNKFSGTLKLEDVDNSPKLEGALRVNDLDGLFLASILTGRYNLDDKSGLFDAPLYGDHSVDVQVQAGVFGAENALMQDAEMRLIYRDGSLALRDFSATGADGQVKGNLDAQNNAGTILLNGQIIMRDVDFMALLPSLPEEMTAQGNLALTFTGSGRSQNALTGSLTGSGAMTAENIQIPAINVNAIAPMLRRADTIGYEITDAQIQEIAQSETSTGAVVIPSLEVPVSLTSGVLAASNIAVAVGPLGLAGDVRYSIDSGGISGDARISYDAGDSSIAGARPEIGLTFEQPDRDSPVDVSRDFTLLSAFVRQRALEREQARVEALQARLLEKQRLRREVRYMKYLKVKREEALEAARQRRLELEAQQREAEKQRQEELRLQEETQAAEKARAAAEKRAAEEAVVRQRTSEEPGTTAPDGNAADDALIEDPLRPIPQSGRIFEDMDLGLGN